MLLNVLAAWLRWLSVWTESYAIALVSSIILGGASAIVICSFTAVSEHLFPPEQRTLATTIAVQSNYFGWALGSLIPSIVSDISSMQTCMLVQACLVSLSLPAYLLASPPPACGSSAAVALPPPPSGTAGAAGPSSDNVRGGSSDSSDGDELKLSLRESFLSMATNTQLLLHGLAYSMMAGVSFAVTAVQDSILTDLGFASTCAQWTNFAFITSGVGAGLILGMTVTDAEQYAPTLRLLFLLTALAMTALVALTVTASSFDDEYVLFGLLVLGMASLGVGSLGFIGMGLHVAVQVGHPVAAEYVGGGVEWFVQAWGATLTEVVSYVSTLVDERADVVCNSTDSVENTALSGGDGPSRARRSLRRLSGRSIARGLLGLSSSGVDSPTYHHRAGLRALYGTDDTYCMNGDALCSEAPLWWAWLPLLVGAWVATLVLCVARFPSYFPGEMDGMAVPLAEIEPAPLPKSSKAAGKQRAK